MKRLLSIVLLICMLASLPIFASSCAAGQSADIHVFYYTFSDPYISNVRNSLDSQLKAAGLSFQDHDGNGNQTTQTEQIQTAITNGAKAIVVNIVNTGSDDAANGIITLAKNAGIPVVFFNREVSDAAVKSYDRCAFVGTDAKEAGILQGQIIGQYVKDNFKNIDINGDGEISYVLFKGEEGNNEAIYRTKYSVEEADKILREGGLKPLRFYDPSNQNKYLVDRNGQWAASAANEYMTTALTSYNEDKGNMIELVICNNDGMAEGAIAALNNAGYNLGKGSRQIPVFGVDATEAAVDLIEKGKMTGTVKQDASGMADAVSKVVVNSLTDGKKLTDGLDAYAIDSGVTKIRIPYSAYLGKGEK
ncbi:MAG: galactose ABC transporter substrate-binding protein [Clostridia bacterium]|nr:galactose ABC transporter substrate-binding protein [Clostridia bacterium]